MSNRELAPTTDYKALEEFVVNNDELLQLEERIGRFNIFDALGIVNAEIRHSNFLAWLLDPNESHGQGPLFLKAILMDLFRQSPPELRAINPVKIDGTELRGVEVRREWRNIDILIYCKDPAFVIAIENKVGSKEHSKQLERYRKTVKQEFGNTRNQFVFLTRDGDEPTDEDWTVYTYEDIHRVLLRVRKTHAASIGDDVLAFLDHYIRLIGSRFMDDPKIDELCQTIYKNHRQAIDLIVERGGISLSGSILNELAAVLDNGEIRWHVFTRTGRRLDFAPESWLEWLPDNSSLPKQHPKYWLRWFVDVNEKSRFLRLYLEVSPCRDQVLRNAVIERLTTDPEEFGLRVQAAKGIATDRFTRLYSERLGRWAEKDDPSPAMLAGAGWDKIAKLHHRLAGIPDALRPVIDAWEKRKKK